MVAEASASFMAAASWLQWLRLLLLHAEHTGMGKPSSKESLVKGSLEDCNMAAAGATRIIATRINRVKRLINMVWK